MEVRHTMLSIPQLLAVVSVAHSREEGWRVLGKRGEDVATTGQEMGAFDSQQVTWLLVSCLGHTYDRSIMVDGEEASLMVYDIWEQVGCRPEPMVGVGS